MTNERLLRGAIVIAWLGAMAECGWGQTIDLAVPTVSVMNADDCGFYNVMWIPDAVGDATLGAPSYVDIRSLTIRQWGQYVQFVWEANGNPRNTDGQFFFLVLDTDFNPSTGQGWGGIGGELKIGVGNDGLANLVYFDGPGSVVKEVLGIPVVYEGNRFYLTIEKSLIPADSFNLYSESSGATPYGDGGPVRTITLEPVQGNARLVVETDQMVLAEAPPLIAMADKQTAVQLHTYLEHDGARTLLPATEVVYSVSHPIQDPRLSDPSSIISVTPAGVATYHREGFVFVAAYSRACFVSSTRVIVAAGRVYGDPQHDNVLAVFPPDYRPQGSPFTFGQMMTTYPSFIKLINQGYGIMSDLYNGFIPLGGDRQILALVVMEGLCGGAGNPLQTAPGCYMNSGDGTPQYEVILHEMGHNFSHANAMMELYGARGYRLALAGFGEGVASLPLIYMKSEFTKSPGKYGIARGSFELNYFNRSLLSDIPYAQSQLNKFESLVRNGQAKGVFDNKGLFDGVATFCSFFQSYSYGFTTDPNPYGNEVIKRFLHIFGDRQLPDWQEEKVETYFSAAFGVAVGQDVRGKLRFWGFEIDDAYYNRLITALSPR